MYIKIIQLPYLKRPLNILVLGNTKRKPIKLGSKSEIGKDNTPGKKPTKQSLIIYEVNSQTNVEKAVVNYINKKF